MNKLNSAALLAAGLFAGIGLSAVVLIGSKLPQKNQVAESQPVAGPITVQQTRLTQQNFDTLPTGATLARVESILGKGQLSSQSENGNFKHEVWSWSENGSNITLGFSNGTLNHKSAFNLKQEVTPVALPTTAQSPVQPVATTPGSAPAVPQPVAFERLSPCDQLDSVARAGKSVSEFLVVAHQVNDLAKYKAAISSTCPWNNEQLAVADRIMNPPVIAQPSVVRQPNVVRQPSGGSSGGSTIVVRERPAPAWNNCNGVQEPGESYSARCETAQELNDAGLGNRWSNRVDNRPRSEIDPGWNTGRQGPANGYSARP